MTALVINEMVQIPAGMDDLESFRRWARSGEMPQHGWYSFIAGKLWVDLSMEKLFTHNQVKGEYAVVLGSLAKAASVGRYFHDRTLLSHPGADLSTEPDGTFVSWAALETGRIRLVEAEENGDFVELEGTPDMVLEVVSKGSVRKDTVELLDSYWRAGIPEYWLVDARTAPARFDIFRHTAERYVAHEAQDGWLVSEVFGRMFQLSQQADRLGHPLYTLSVR